MTVDAVTTHGPNRAPLIIPGLDQLRCFEAGKWSPVRTGDYSKDCETGRRAGEDLIEIMERADNPMFLGAVARSIVATGKFEGVEVGFFTAIALRL